MKLYVPYVRHESGLERPKRDTLLSVCLKSGRSDVTVRFRVFDSTGAAVSGWTSPAQEYGDYSLTNGHSMAFSFVNSDVFPNHAKPFSNPPQDFEGYATVESIPDTPIAGYCALGAGRGWTKSFWSNYAAWVPLQDSLVARSRFEFPYLIPVFEDCQHPGTLAYQARLVVTNFDDSAATLMITYRIGAYYPDAGKLYTFQNLPTVPSHGQKVFDLHAELLNNVDPTFTQPRTEGVLIMQSVVSGTTTPAPLKLLPLLINVNADDNFFSATTDFWQP